MPITFALAWTPSPPPLAKPRRSMLNAEIVVVDNGSTDDTTDTIKAWTSASPFPVRLLLEPKAGLSRAHNLALRAARGDLLAFTDDDCRLHKDYVTDLLRHHAADTEPVLRGGRIELGDPTDLPLTTKTTPDPMRWNRRMNSARRLPITGQINGCNMTMPRAIAEKLGPFDERFGGGAIIPSDGDSDYLFRAYLAYITLEYVPDMTVLHYHGRKTPDVGRTMTESFIGYRSSFCRRSSLKTPSFLAFRRSMYRSRKTKATRSGMLNRSTFGATCKNISYSLTGGSPEIGLKKTQIVCAMTCGDRSANAAVTPSYIVGWRLPGKCPGAA